MGSPLRDAHPYGAAPHPRSISEVLERWEGDAEEILYNLGFARSEPGTASRIPMRFFTAPSRAKGIDFQLFLKAQVRRMEMEDPCLTLASERRPRPIPWDSLRWEKGSGFPSFPSLFVLPRSLPAGPGSGRHGRCLLLPLLLRVTEPGAAHLPLLLLQGSSPHSQHPHPTIPARSPLARGAAEEGRGHHVPLHSAKG